MVSFNFSSVIFLFRILLYIIFSLFITLHCKNWNWIKPFAGLPIAVHLNIFLNFVLTQFFYAYRIFSNTQFSQIISLNFFAIYTFLCIHNAHYKSSKKSVKLVLIQKFHKIPYFLLFITPFTHSKSINFSFYYHFPFSFSIYIWMHQPLIFNIPVPHHIQNNIS